MEKFGETLEQSGSRLEALQEAGGGWQEARDALIDTRMDQVQGYGLTDAQMAFFRAASESFLPAGVHDLLDTDTSRATAQAREALIRAEGPTGEHIAELLTRSAISQDDTYLRTIGAYNSGEYRDHPGFPPSEPKQRLRRMVRRGARPGGRAGVSRQLQRLVRRRRAGPGGALGAHGASGPRAAGRLVRSNGGSAVGRYQFIDDTLDGLVERLGLSGNERFTPELQDRMAMHLARDAGMDDWLTGRLSDERFAANLSRVWAGLPGDGSNGASTRGFRATGRRSTGTPWWPRCVGFAEARVRSGQRCRCRRAGIPATSTRWLRECRSSVAHPRQRWLRAPRRASA